MLLSAGVALVALYVLIAGVANSASDPQDNRQPALVIGFAVLSLASAGAALRSAIRAHRTPEGGRGGVVTWLVLTMVLIAFTFVAGFASGHH